MLFGLLHPEIGYQRQLTTPLSTAIQSSTLSLPRHHKQTADIVTTHAPYDVPRTTQLIKRDVKAFTKKVKAKTKKLFGKSEQSLTSTDDVSHDRDRLPVREFTPPRHDDSHRTRRGKEKGKQPARDQTDDTSSQARETGSAAPPSESSSEFDPPDELGFGFRGRRAGDLVLGYDDPIPDLWPDFDGVHCIPFDVADQFLDGDPFRDFDGTHYVPDSDPELVYSAAVPSDDNVYHTLEAHIFDYYKNRDVKELDNEKRWIVRGLTILMHLALLNCPSNPAYQDLDKGQPCFNHSASMFIAKPVRVSKMPAEVYAEPQKPLDPRHDSAMTPEPDVSGEDLLVLEPKTPSNIWYSLTIACQKRESTLEIVEGILHLVEPELDVRKFALQLGDPLQKVEEQELDDLRKKLRLLLFPEWESLF